MKTKISENSDSDIKKNLEEFEANVDLLLQISSMLHERKNTLKAMANHVTSSLSKYVYEKHHEFSTNFDSLKKSTVKLILDNDQRREQLQSRMQNVNQLWYQHYDAVMNEVEENFALEPLEGENGEVPQYTDEAMPEAHENLTEEKLLESLGELTVGFDPKSVDRKVQQSCEAMVELVDKMVWSMDDFLINGEAKIQEYVVFARILFKDNIDRGIEYRKIIEANESKVRTHFANLKGFI